MSQVLKLKILFLVIVGLLISCTRSIAQNSTKSLLEKRNKEAFDLRNTDAANALDLNMSVLKDAQGLEDDTLNAVIFSVRGVLLRNTKQFDSASYYTIKSLKLREKIGDQLEIAKSFNNLGSIYFDSEQFDQALNYYQQSLRIKKKSGRSDKLAAAYNNIANVYDELGLLDSAIYYYNEGLSYDDSNPYTLDEINLNLGIIYNRVNQPKKSQKILLELYPYLEDTYDKSLCLHNLGISFEGIEQYDSAQYYIDLAEVYADTLNYLDLNRDLAKSKLIVSLKKNNNVDGLKYLNQYENNNNFINEEIVASNIAELDADYQIEKKDVQIRLEEEKTKRVQAEDDEKYWIIIALIGLLSLIILAVLFITRFYAQKRRLVQFELEHNKKEIESLMKGYELDLFEAQIFGQQEERQRVANDLHDRLGGLLAAVNLQVESLKYTKEEDKPNELAIIKSMISEGISEVRNISHNMQAEALKKHGLKGALEGICQSIVASKKLRIDLYLEGLKDSSGSEIEREVYKIIMELISNTLKHAQAKLITLQINEIDHELTIVFEDDGRGFNYVESEMQGLGIKSINQRVDKLNGNVQIDSQANNGTTIIINIPQL